jgi:hypothetical protein
MKGAKIDSRRCFFNGRVKGGPVAVVQQHLAVHPEPTPRARQALVDPAQHRGLNIERLGRLLLERLNEDGLARVQAPANNVSFGFAHVSQNSCHRGGEISIIIIQTLAPAAARSSECNTRRQGPGRRRWPGGRFRRTGAAEPSAGRSGAAFLKAFECNCESKKGALLWKEERESKEQISPPEGRLVALHDDV